MSDKIKHLTSKDFDQTCTEASKEKPLLLDFWAEWCGPCKAIAPALEELAEERADSLTIGKVDVDAEGELAQRFNVQAIPTLCLVVDGEVVSHHTGAVSKKQLEAFIDSQ